MLRRASTLLLTFALWCAAASGSAHDPGLSELTISHGALGVRFEWVIGNADLPKGLGCNADSVIAVSREEQRLPLHLRCRPYDETHTAFSAALATLTSGELRFELRLLQQLARGHRVFARVFDRDGRLIDKRLLDRTNGNLQTTIARPTLWCSRCW